VGAVASTGIPAGNLVSGSSINENDVASTGIEPVSKV